MGIAALEWRGIGDFYEKQEEGEGGRKGGGYAQADPENRKSAGRAG